MAPSLRGLTPLIQVYDMAASVAFYRNVLGFTVVATSTPGETFYWAMLRHGSSTLMLNTAYEDDERPAAPDPIRQASHADTTFYFDCDDVEQVHAHLLASGWHAAAPVTTHYHMRQVSTTDPDGYGLCFQHPVK